MRNRTGWGPCVGGGVRVGLVMAAVLLTAAPGRGQDDPRWMPSGAAEVESPRYRVIRGQNNNYEVPPPNFIVPWPFGHPRMEDGGFYFAGEFVTYKMTNPLGSQPVAFRGFLDRDGSIAQALGLTTVPEPGTFIGDRSLALSVDDASGPSTLTPGFNFVLGWRFRSGIALEFSWLHLFETRQSATASQNILTGQGPFGENTFLFSPVFNYPIDYDGPGNQVGIGNVGATSGIWNAASLMTIDFLQRFDRFQVSVRYPLQEDDCWRTYGLFGPRISWLWERFKWRSVDADVDGLVAADDAAEYSNVVSQRLYGVHIGIGNEWVLGNLPIGTFSFSLDLEGALSANFVKGRAKYEIGDFHTAASRARNFFTVVPEVNGALNLWWYPYEAVQLRFGYSFMAFFNTMAAIDPIDFNYGALSPEWDRGVTRILHGFNAGFSFIF